MNNFIESYNLILSHLAKFDLDFSQIVQIRKPKLSNLELIAMNLTAEYSGLDSECQLFRTIKGTALEEKIERSVYNRRKRFLFDQIENVRKVMAQEFNDGEDFFIVDSMPAEVCKNARSSRSKVCKESIITAPDKGYCASQKMYYYGYKIHGVCSVKGVFQSIDITQASVHDIHLLKDINYSYSDCTLLGDMGYLSAEHQLNLFQTANIKLETPMRKNQKAYRKQPYIFRKCRKRIETLFSQLCDQFNIRRNYAKTFLGFKTRILSKITAMTMIQYLNKQVFNRPINNIKVNIA